MPAADFARPLIRLLRWLVPALALALYAAAANRAGTFDPGTFDAGRGDRRTVLEAAAAATATGPSPGEDHALAEAYWRRYPDVAADRNYGVHGQLGPAGAFEHYQRHGQREGRIWGAAPP